MGNGVRVIVAKRDLERQLGARRLCARRKRKCPVFLHADDARIGADTRDREDQCYDYHQTSNHAETLFTSMNERKASIAASHRGLSGCSSNVHGPRTIATSRSGLGAEKQRDAECWQKNVKRLARCRRSDCQSASGGCHRDGARRFVDSNPLTVQLGANARPDLTQLRCAASGDDPS